MELDDFKLNLIIDILLKKGYIQQQIKKEWFLAINRESNNYELHEWINRDDYDSSYIIHHPDISVMCNKGLIDFIIELDGGFHDSNRGQRQTISRNTNYYNAGISCLTINERDCDIMNYTWEMMINQFLNNNKKMINPKFDLP